MTDILLNNYRPKNQSNKEPEKYLWTPEEVVKGVKSIFRRTLLEDEDFHISEHNVLVDRKYISKSYLDFYVEELNKKFPGLVKVQNTHISIHYPEGQSYDKPSERSPDNSSTSE